MKSGEIIEYIENSKIVCAIILKVDGVKLKILAESGREIKLSISRIIHKSTLRLDLFIGKAQLIDSIKHLSIIRDKIAKSINIKNLWSQVQKTAKWIEINSISKLYFNTCATEQEEAGLIRAIFNDKFYFRFKPGFLYPNSKEKVAKLKTTIFRAEQQKKMIEIISVWISMSSFGPVKNNLTSETRLELETILCSYYAFGKSSIHYHTAKKILLNSNITSKEELFNFLVKIGTWDINENVEIFRCKIPTKFSSEVIKRANNIKQTFQHETKFRERVDLTDEFTMSIDGPDTLDFDDALSIVKKKNYYLIGIHISDVAHYVERGNEIDEAARRRICSIYMPDMEIPMLPHHLSKNICSLKKGEIKATISTIVKLDFNGKIIHYSIFHSFTKVDKQFTYNSANKAIKYCKKLTSLHKIAIKLRERRIKNGAVQISLPELSINLKKNDNSSIVVKKINRESPSKIIITEMMILSNWITAQYLSYHKIPAIFRSQPEPRNNMIRNHPDSLYHNWMQKKMLRKLDLKNQAKRHCILGLNAYTTSTSPIRKYSDLVTQRQIKALIYSEQGYKPKELKEIVQVLLQNTSKISKVQSLRHRYWLLKHLENKVGENVEALVLQKNRNSYNILMKSYMLECNLYQSNGIDLKPQDIIRVTIQHASARNNVISVFMR